MEFVMGKGRAGSAARKTKDRLDESLESVIREREIIVFRSSQGKKPLAALVPLDGEAQLEALEDQIDAREARKALKERSVPFTVIAI
jgi:hypothetical protein